MMGGSDAVAAKEWIANGEINSSAHEAILYRSCPLHVFGIIKGVNNRNNDRDLPSATCVFCRGTLKKQTTTYTREVAGRIVVIRHVPALVCSQCGHTYYAADTIDRLHAAVRQGKSETTETVPVYDFPAL